jgi:hypothetical protein
MLALASSGSLQVLELPEGKVNRSNVVKLGEKIVSRGSIMDLHWRN